MPNLRKICQFLGLKVSLLVLTNFLLQFELFSATVGVSLGGNVIYNYVNIFEDFPKSTVIYRKTTTFIPNCSPKHLTSQRQLLITTLSIVKPIVPFSLIQTYSSYMVTTTSVQTSEKLYMYSTNFRGGPLSLNYPN